MIPTASETPSLPEFLAATVLSGESTWISGRDEVVLRRGDVVRFPTTIREPSWAGDDVALIGIPLDTVQRLAETRFGIAGAGLHFDGMAAHWRALTALLHHALNAPGSLLEHSLVHARVVDRVAVMALAVFPNTTMEANEIGGPGQVAPPAVRRAAAFIDANAGEPITLADVAVASGVTPRAMQHAFDMHYGMAPMAYLRRVRLEGAHRDLQAADPTVGATVAGIAARWGFGNVAHFTDFYRAHFGAAPGDTLRS